MSASPTADPLRRSCAGSSGRCSAPRRAAARRLPHAVPRRRARSRRPARVPVQRRRAPHRLERHRAAAGRRTCASSTRTARSRRGSCSTCRRRSTSARGGTSKRAVLAAEFVALLARLLTRHGNRVGAALRRRVDTVIPPRSGRRHVLHLLASLLQPAAGESRNTDLARCCCTRCARMRRRSLVFLVSDFISVPGWAPWLARLAQRHEVIAIRLYDPLEMELPDIGGVLMQDAETGEQIWVDTTTRASAALRRRGRPARAGAAQCAGRCRRRRARAVHRR
jgi:hypothetical protein